MQLCVMQEAALHQKVMAAKQQRLTEAESSNAGRASRVETAQRGLQDLQVSQHAHLSVQPILVVSRGVER